MIEKHSKTLLIAASAVSASAFLMPGMAVSYLANNASAIYDKAKSFFKMHGDFGFESFFSPVKVTAHPHATEKSDNKITCMKTHIFGPEELFIAQGSKTVLINGQPAARNGDKSTCEAVIDHEQIGPRVRIGGPTVTVRNIKSGKHPWATFAGEMIGSMGKGAIRCLLSGVVRNFTKNGLKHALKDFAKTLPKKIGCVFAGQALATGLSVPVFAGLGNIIQSANPIHYGTGAKLLAEGELDFTLSGRQPIMWQQDPIGLAGGINLYQYAPNPLSWVDPLGWEKCGPTHHIATNKHSTWSDKFRILFEKNGLGKFKNGKPRKDVLKDPLNKIDVSGHKGPHPNSMHDKIYKLLINASKKGPEAFKKELEKLRKLAVTPGSWLNKILTMEDKI